MICPRCRTPGLLEEGRYPLYLIGGQVLYWRGIVGDYERGAVIAHGIAGRCPRCHLPLVRLEGSGTWSGRARHCPEEARLGARGVGLLATDLSLLFSPGVYHPERRG